MFGIKEKTNINYAQKYSFTYILFLNLWNYDSHGNGCWL